MSSTRARENEDLTASFFRRQGYTCTRGDEKKSQSGQGTYWICSKDALMFLCEVKTIFSTWVGHGDSRTGYSSFIAGVQKVLSQSPVGKYPFSVVVASTPPFYNPSFQERQAF